MIGPLRAQGYRELWLAGTSMGGFGAVGLRTQHPERIAGLLLFAPYMGSSGVTDEVVRAAACANTARPSATSTTREALRAPTSAISAG